jgi:hypothetical protein
VANGLAKPVAIMLLIIATLAASIHSCGAPPSEQSLIEGFYAHRPAFEHLRDMLSADQRVVRIANWGVETTTNVVAQIPPKGDFPVDRYKEYLAGLKAVGGEVVILMATGTFGATGNGPQPPVVNDSFGVS